jgi:hypothetical protein
MLRGGPLDGQKRVRTFLADIMRIKSPDKKCFHVYLKENNNLYLFNRTED